jgi:hypothetical protein
LNLLKWKTSFKLKKFSKVLWQPLESIAKTLKIAAQNPDFVKTVAKNGFGKGLKATAGALAAERIMHKLKVGHIYEYKIEGLINSQPSKEFFSFKLNGPSYIRKPDRKK